MDPTGRHRHSGAMKMIAKIILWVLAGIGGLVTVILGAIVTFTLTAQDKAPPMPEVAVLSLDWNRAVPENHPTLPFFEDIPQETLLETIQALDLAATTPAVEALIVQFGGVPMSFARAQELAAAVRRFRESGKPAYAFTEDLATFGDGTPEMLLAASFDTVWMAPSGAVGLTGVALEMPYAAEALDDLGITPEFEQRHEFKGGGDPLTQRRMPVPIRQSLGKLAAELLDEAVREIAEGRKLSDEAVRDLVDTGPHLGREAVAAGLIDGLMYWDEAEAEIQTRVGETAEWIEAPYFLAATTQDSSPEEESASVAVLYGLGPIGAGQEEGPFDDQGFASAELIETMGEIAETGSHDAVLFRVDSPGGAYGPSDAVWHAVETLRTSGVPVVVSMGEVAASGGYFVSTAAERIVAMPTTITGSIGVYGGKFDASEFWGNLGVRWDRVSVGQNAGMWSLNRSFDGPERERFAAMMDFVYEDFTSKVATGRGLDAVNLDAAARGRVWSGTSAMEVGLVDRLGGLYEAQMEIRAVLNLPDDAVLHLEVLPEPKQPWDAFVEAAQSGEFSMAVESLVVGAVERRVSNRLEAVIGEADWFLGPTGVLSLPPVRLSR